MNQKLLHSLFDYKEGKLHPKCDEACMYLCQMRELTDEEINKLWAESHEDGIAVQQGFTTQQHYFAHLILRKASEK